MYQQKINKNTVLLFFFKKREISSYWFQVLIYYTSSPSLFFLSFSWLGIVRNFPAKKEEDSIDESYTDHSFDTSVFSENKILVCCRLI